MTYNILNYEDDDGREADMRTVIHYVSPDILMAEEVHNTNGFNHFLSDVLNYDEPGLYEGAFIDQPTPDIDIALFYKPDLFEVLSTTTIDITSQWGHRDALECILVHETTGIEFRLFGVHLKAGTDSETERESEADNLREYLNSLNPNTHFLVLGDFNFYKSDEGGFHRLTESQGDNDGQLFDPIDRIGYWHNNSSFADVHTQSSRDYYQNQNYGGIDDRFDFILASSAVVNFTELNYVNDSYVAFGNDGEHYNQAINEGSNYVVPDNVADALVAASDHIPVYMELQFMGVTESSYQVVITEIMQNPAAVYDRYGEWFELYNADSVAIDLCNWTIKDVDNDSSVVECFDYFWIDPGQYLVFGRNSDSSSNGGVHIDYEFSFTLGNTYDELILISPDGIVVDSVVWDDGATFPDPTGASMALVDPALDNNLGSNWVISTRPYGDGDFGTPGEANYDVSVVEELVIPEAFRLYQNYPNPFNPVTTIEYQLPNSSFVDLVVYNIQGQLIERLVHVQQSPGTYMIKWNASNVSSGIYFYKISAGEYTLSRKLLLLK
ncbi:MAG: lamin tail domain-containing protein [Candidatus Marinimicrobia bacterium]|nr:lamin tail domain-containing protein [Candidatus Neomarinimicrobiota bacterium]